MIYWAIARHTPIIDIVLVEALQIAAFLANFKQQIDKNKQTVDSFTKLNSFYSIKSLILLVHVFNRWHVSLIFAKKIIHFNLSGCEYNANIIGNSQTIAVDDLPVKWG